MKIITKYSLNGSILSPEKIVEQLLKLRKIDGIEHFLSPKHPAEHDLSEFVDKKLITKAVKLIEEHTRKGNTIVVYTDYDADGITGGTILWETLHKMGCKVLPFVPHRQTDGYGFSIHGIDKMLEEQKPSLVISVDHGIAAVDQVKYLRDKGVDVIITDHHTKQAVIPDSANAIFHIPQLSGAGVAYYFAKAVSEKLAPENKELKELFETEYCAIAAIGAVADLVPLVGPTRSLVKHGLGELAAIKRIGLRQLMLEAQITDRAVTPFDIGFIIAPRINAIGRLEHALDALRLLCTSSKSKAQLLTKKLASTNDSRKGLVDKAIKQAKKMVEEMSNKNGPPRILIVRSDDWHEGIIGLIASKLAEEYYRPAIVLTKSESYLKASCRSPVTVNITELLARWKDNFLNYGGHHQAAGFSITEENFEPFYKMAMSECNEYILEEALERFIEADMQMPLSLANIKLAELLNAFEPFGIGNSRPVFYSKGTVIDFQRLGKQKNHLKLWLRDPAKKSAPIEFIAFSKGEDAEKLTKNQEIDVVYTIEINIWNGRTSVQGKLLYWE